MLTVPLIPKLREAQQGMSSCACGMQLRMQLRMLLESIASHFTVRQEAVDIVSVGMQLRHDGLMRVDRGAAVAVVHKLLELLASRLTPNGEAVPNIFSTRRFYTSKQIKSTRFSALYSKVGVQLRHDGLMELDTGAAVAVLENLLEFLALAGSKQPWSSDAQRVTRSSGQAVLEVEALALDRD